MTVRIACLLILFLGGCSGEAAPGVAKAARWASVPAATTPVGPVPGTGLVPPPVENPYAGDDTAAQAGKRLFAQFNCAGCHGDHGGGGMGPSLRDETWIYGNSPGQLFQSVSQGRAHGMPAWGTRLPPQEVWLLVSYVQSLRTPREPQPPTD